MKNRNWSLVLLLMILSFSPSVQVAVRADASPTHIFVIPRTTIATMFAGTAASTSPQQATAPPQAKAESPLPEGKGKDLTKKLCGSCHSTNVWTNQRHTGEKWNSIIDNMVSKGLVASDDELAAIGDYLTVNFGPAVPATPPQDRR